MGVGYRQLVSLLLNIFVIKRLHLWRKKKNKLKLTPHILFGWIFSVSNKYNNCGNDPEYKQMVFLFGVCLRCILCLTNNDSLGQL